MKSYSILPSSFLRSRALLFSGYYSSYYKIRLSFLNPCFIVSTLNTEPHFLIGHSSFLSLGSFHSDNPNYYRLSSFFIFVTWLTKQQQRRPTLLMHQFLLMKLIFPSCTGQGNPDLFPLLLLDSLACSRTLPLLPIIRLILMASPPPLFS